MNDVNHNNLEYGLISYIPLDLWKQKNYISYTTYNHKNKPNEGHPES